MEDFKKLPKMQHFKEGGGVKNAMCSGRTVKKYADGKLVTPSTDKRVSDLATDLKNVASAANIPMELKGSGVQTYQNPAMKSALEEQRLKQAVIPRKRGGKVKGK